MTSLQTWVQQVNMLVEQVNALEPDPQRDWFGEKRLDAIAELVDKEVLPHAQEALAEVDHEDERRHLAGAVVQVVESASALRFAAGRQSEGLRWLERVEPLARGTGEEELLAAARRDPEGFMRLSRAWWHLKADDHRRAKDLAQPIAKGGGLFGEQAQQVLDAPRPIRRAPGLGTLNGFGMSIYGNRDQRADGTFVTTRYLTGLFVPLMPLDAYRVANAEKQGTYYFIGKVPLGAVTKAWRLLVVLALVLVPTGLWAQSYLNSPERQLALAFQEIKNTEKSASTPAEKEAVLSRYEALLTKNPWMSTRHLQPAAMSVVRLIAASVPEPLTHVELGKTHLAIKRYLALPDGARREGAAEHFVTKIAGWAKQLGGSRQSLEAAVDLLQRAQQLAEGTVPTALAGLKVQRNEIEYRMALALAKAGWTLEAIRRLGALDERRSTLELGKLLAKANPKDAAIWLELAPILSVWGRKVGTYKLVELPMTPKAAQAQVKAARVRAKDPARKELLQQKDTKVLQKALKATPLDQELAVVAATLLRQKGKAQAARASLEKLGHVGMLARPAQSLLGSLLVDGGELKRAEEILEIQLGARLPAFERSRRRYSEARQKRAAALVAQAKRRIPIEIESELRVASKDKQGDIFQRWLAKKLNGDAHLETLRSRFMVYGDVVPTALTLGTIKLRRAARTRGAARHLLLSRAERVFLAIQGEAAGIPSYHLGLGQVYYRLGKREAGAKEFAALLARKDAPLSLAVCTAYRDLGMVKEARQQTKVVYEAFDTPHKQGAAVLMALMARDDEEKETWLRRANNKDAYVRMLLLEVQARRLQKQNDRKGADRKLAEVVAFYKLTAKNTASSANNAALALQARFACTAKRAHLDEALKMLEHARRLEPDSALILTNLAEILSRRISIRTFEKFYPLSLLQRADVTAPTVLGWLLDGPRRMEVRRDIANNPDFRRVLEVSQQAEVLGPSRTSSYSVQSNWLSLVEDAKGLRALWERLERVKSLDVADRKAYRAKQRSGANDAKDLKRARTRLGQLDKLEAKAGGDKVAMAAIYLQKASLHHRIAFLSKDAKEAVVATGLRARAMVLHPAFNMGASGADSLILAALLSTCEKSPQLAKRHASEARGLDNVTFLYQLAQTDEALAQQVMQQKDWKVAIRMIRARLSGSEREPRLNDLMIALLAGDKALLARTKSALDKELNRLSLQIGKRLDPGSEAYDIQLGLFSP
ncbi:MAG: hypothetical protein JRH20_05200 [Deltaproteobacteria bacterium]|nr:hypothetical protein [Deltaproteobacteria bacterium]